MGRSIATDEPAHGRAHSLVVTLPPLAIGALRAGGRVNDARRGTRQEVALPSR